MLTSTSLADNYDVDLALNNVTYDPEAPNAAGRCLATHKRQDGTTERLLLERLPSIPASLPIALIQLRDELPTHYSRRRRPEEVRTLRIAGLQIPGPNQPAAALAYELPYVPPTLRDVLEGVPKPAPGDRCLLASLVATQVRSLHVHFRNKHMALRTESFVFLREGSAAGKKGPGAGLKGLDLRYPYVLDWGRESRPSMYQHPRFDPDRKKWYYDVWSLMVVLTEIADWKPLDPVDARNEKVMREKKMELKRRVTNPQWKGEATAAVFRYGFGILEEEELDKVTWSGIKRFFDGLCELLESSGSMPT